MHIQLQLHVMNVIFSVPVPLPLALIFRAYKKFARHGIAAAVTPTHRRPPYILYPIHTGTNCRISIVADRLLTHWTPKPELVNATE